MFAAVKRSQAEIARELDISRQSVSRWFKAWRQDNPNWIRGAGRAGRRPQLDKAQLKQVDKALRQGAQAHGFATALWTLPRVAAVIERTTGVHYHPSHVWKILATMEWSLQRPAKRARERNEEGRRLWMAKRWPAIKKRPATKSLDTLPGRKRSLGATAGKADLGAEGGDSGVGLCLQLEEAVDQRGARLSLGRQALPVVISDPARQLQRRAPDCFRA
jgi:transposase